MSLKEIAEKMSRLTAVVAGDAIVDVYVFGRVERICPEGPVPVFVPVRAEEREGGALHTAAQCREVGAHTYAVFGSPPSVKTRYMAAGQLVLRVDGDEIPEITEADFLEQFDAKMTPTLQSKPIDVLILSDYGKGVLTPSICQRLIDFARGRSIPVIVDPKGSDWSKYAGADWICPNEAEWKAVSEVGSKFTGRILRKLGDRGLMIDQEVFPPRAKRVADVTGAGDIVVAVFALALATGASASDAARLANIAASWSVGEIGTVCCGRELLIGLASIEDEYAGLELAQDTNVKPAVPLVGAPSSSRLQ
jgi:D-beta-D-heptose 7-phosphate kinase/D-beta-D-heptose 1-phosphate adenosyltransferase